MRYQLTKTAVEKAKHPGGTNAPVKLSDGGGMSLWVMPNGTKAFRYQYRHDGKQKTLALGVWPDVSLALARERHAEARQQLARGVDPSAEKKRAGAASGANVTTFSDCFKVWFDFWKQGKEGRHVAQTERRVNADVIPAFGAKAADEVTPADVREMMLKIFRERGARDIAKRNHETVNQIYRHAVVHGLAKQNPAAAFKPNDVLPQVTSENMARVDVKELPALLTKLDGYNGTAVSKLAMRLLALTFVRTSELIEAPWSEFDVEAARWEIPAERMKMPSNHIVPLSKQAVEVLKALKMLTGTHALVFPGDLDKKKPMSNNTLLKMLERCGYKGKMTGHGWRGIASTVLHEQGFDEAVIELQLAHMPRNKVASAYNHAKHIPERTRMMEWWGNYLDEQRQKAANAV
jgi:integrase